MLYLKFRRIELDLTCREVAKHVGLSNGWYGQIERGRINLSTDELTRIAKALKCAPERLMTHVTDAVWGEGAEQRDAECKRSFVGKPAAGPAQA